MIAKNRYKFSDLLDIMAQLRSENGCPWDKKQTHESILNCLVEESAEFIDAVIGNDVPNMREELGDILLQVVFHSQMAKETGNFNITDVVHEICEKLVRRHPHVFADETAENSDEVMSIWEDVKEKEKAGNSPKKRSLLEGIPKKFEPLLKAEKIQKKAAKVGFDWPDFSGPLQKIKEEMEELIDTLPGSAEHSQEHCEEELGDVLFSMVNLARHLKINPALALEKSNHKFRLRFETMHELCENEGQQIDSLSLTELDIYWEKAKKSLLKNKVIKNQPQTED